MSRRGFTLVETLIALAIGAALLAATAVATDAALKAHSVNQATVDLTQNSRQALYRILTELRASLAQQPVSASAISSFARGAEVVDGGVTLIRADGTELTIAFDSATKRVTVTVAGSTRTLLNGVESFEVRLKPTWSYNADNRRQRVAVLQRATVKLVVSVPAGLVDIDASERAQTMTLSGSVTPRQRVW